MPVLTSIIIGNNAVTYTKQFTTANFTSLRTLVLGSGAFKYCESFVVENVPQLTRLEIGSSCCQDATVFSLGCACRKSG